MTAITNGQPAAPPQDLEAERSVLGVVLLSDTALPALTIDERLEAADFYRESHGLIYQAMLDLHSVGEPVDRVTLGDQLEQAGHLEKVGGRAAIELLAGPVPAVGNFRAYARIVREKAWLRRLLAASYELQEGAFSGNLDVAAAAASRVVDTAASRDHTPGGPPAGWLIGAPMDPAAVATEPLPTVPGLPFLMRGNWAMMSGPTGGGRSSLVQAGMYDAARAGLRCAYLGSEVTESEFNARAAILAKRRGDPIDDDLCGALARVRYLNLATTIVQAWAAPDAWASGMVEHFEIVAMDPVSAVASALDLDFDKSNFDFVRFNNALVQPLAAHGVAVLLLDNIGHATEARGRPKGASAKRDCADLEFSCKKSARPVGLILTAKKVRTARAPFVNGDSWLFDRDTQRVQRDTASGSRDHEDAAPRTFRPTGLMEKISSYVEANPGLSRNAILLAIGGNRPYAIQALELVVSEGYVEVKQDGQAHRHHSLKRYRELTDDEPGPTGTQPGPNRDPDPVEGTGSNRVPPLTRGDPVLASPDPAAGTETHAAPSEDDLAELGERLAARHRDIAEGHDGEDGDEPS